MKSLCSLSVGVALLANVSVSAGEAPEFRLGDLPEPVQERLLALFDGEAPASAGSPYNDSDFVQPGLPRRRLVFFARQGDTYFIHYVHGGFSWHAHLVGIQFNRYGAIPTMNVAFYEQFDSLANAQEALGTLRFHSPELGRAINGDVARTEY